MEAILGQGIGFQMAVVERANRARSGFRSTALYRYFNTLSFERAARAGDWQTMLERWQCGVNTRASRLTTLKPGARALLVDLEMLSYLLHGGLFGLPVSKKKAILSAAKIVNGLVGKSLPKECLRHVVANLSVLDRVMFGDQPNHAYRPELRHARRLAKNLRDNADIVYRSLEDRRLHKMALAAMHHSDQVIPYSWNGKYRNCRPDPSVNGAWLTPWGRWVTLMNKINSRARKVDLTRMRLAPYVKRVGKLGIGNCEEFAAVAKLYLDQHGLKEQSDIAYITHGDHAFVLLDGTSGTWVVDPWACKVYRYEEHPEKLKDYVGMQWLDESTTMDDLKPVTAPLTDNQNVKRLEPRFFI